MTKLTFLVTLVAIRAMAGTEIGGGGGDTSPLAHSAWFADGGKPVKYCVQVSKDFGVDETEAKKTILKVIQKWESYLAHKKINHEIVLKYDDPVPCDGKEELAFYLGVRNPEVEKYIVSYNNPAAFSERTDYKMWKKRGKGFIWLAASGKVFRNKFPKWDKPGHLEAMLTHEMGHVLGCSHVKGTIMTSELSKKLAREVEHAKPSENFFKIDWSRELGITNNPTVTVKMTAEIMDRAPGTAKFAPNGVFDLFTGRRGVGKQTIELSGGAQGHFYYFTMRDALGGYKWDLIEAPGPKYNMESTHETFKVANPFRIRDTESIGWSWFAIHDTSRIVHAWLRPGGQSHQLQIHGQSIQVAIEYNTSGCPVVVSVLDPETGYPQGIGCFQSDETGMEVIERKE